MNVEITISARIARMFRALGNPQRMELFECLRKAREVRCEGETAEMCVCDIAGGAKITLSTVSHHLKELKEAGLILCERRGKRIYCSVNKDALLEMESFLGGISK